MKQRLLAGTASALLTAAALGLTGCGGQPASSLPGSSSDVPSIASNPASSNPASSSSSPVSDIPSSSPLPTYTPGAITKEQAIAITRDLLWRTGEIYYLVLHYPSLLKADSSQTIPGEPDFWLVTDERFQSLAHLRSYVETGYTSRYIEENLAHYFCNDKEYGFLEYNGRLYANSRVGGIGNESEQDWDSLRILSQDENSLTVQVDVYVWEKLESIQTYTMKISENIWRLDKEDYKSIRVTE